MSTLFCFHNDKKGVGQRSSTKQPKRETGTLFHNEHRVLLMEGIKDAILPIDRSQTPIACLVAVIRPVADNIQAGQAGGVPLKPIELILVGDAEELLLEMLFDSEVAGT